MQLKEDSTLKGGKYKIGKVLGQGGFGITYLAERNISVKGEIGIINAKIKVTVKEFFMKELCNRDSDTSFVSVPSVGSQALVEKFKAKFLKEVQNIAKLKHNHIIKVLDIFEENGTAYYVMEYVDGGSLNDRISQDGAMSQSEALHYIVQIADALGYIHSQRINHLDVKPSNILIREGAISVLIDFGMSKQYDQSGEQTSSTPVGISRGYAPMEQYNQGGVSSFSPESDIYSLGATLYKLVTAKTPPPANEVYEDGLPELPGELSQSVKRAITSAMQPRRKDRPQSIAEFLEILNVDSEETKLVAPAQKTQTQVSTHATQSPHIENVVNEASQEQPKVCLNKRIVLVLALSSIVYGLTHFYLLNNWWFYNTWFYYTCDDIIISIHEITSVLFYIVTVFFWVNIFMCQLKSQQNSKQRRERLVLAFSLALINIFCLFIRSGGYSGVSIFEMLGPVTIIALYIVKDVAMLRFFIGIRKNLEHKELSYILFAVLFSLIFSLLGRHVAYGVNCASRILQALFFGFIFLRMRKNNLDGNFMAYPKK